MEWKKYSGECWNCGMPKKILGSNGMFKYSFYVGFTDNPDERFMVIPFYTKKYTLSKWTVWCQDKSMAARGGKRFALKIRNCDYDTQGMRIAEQFYEELKRGEQPRNMGTQYINSDLFSCDFFEL